MPSQSIQYGDTRIAFEVQVSGSAMRRVRIHVLPDGAVRVDAPAAASAAEIKAAVRQRARWIWLQLKAQQDRRRHVLPREYVSGESHFYLGRRHVLKVFEAAALPAQAKLQRGRLEVTVPQRDPALVRKALDAWYRKHAREVFQRRIATCSEGLRWLRLPPDLRLLTMRTQWGSCSPKGEVVLNPLLVKAPTPCIDYVITHELCHLKELNHSPRFYRMLGMVMPDWEDRKQRLDEMAELLLNC